MFAMIIVGTLLLSVAGLRGYAQPAPSTPPPAGASTEDRQKVTQNPVANLISAPFQDNIDWNAGPYVRDKNTLNILPVIPLQISKDWNLIIRVITPIICQPDYAQQRLRSFWLGDESARVLRLRKR